MQNMLFGSVFSRETKHTDISIDTERGIERYRYKYRYGYKATVTKMREKWIYFRYQLIQFHRPWSLGFCYTETGELKEASGIILSDSESLRLSTWVLLSTTQLRHTIHKCFCLWMTILSNPPPFLKYNSLLPRIPHSFLSKCNSLFTKWAGLGLTPFFNKPVFPAGLANGVWKFCEGTEETPG